jgi:hypothetical protein
VGDLALTHRQHLDRFTKHGGKSPWPAQWAAKKTGQIIELEGIFKKYVI